MSISLLPEMLYQILDQDILFIDLRLPDQFNQLHIKNFINLSHDEVLSYLSNHKSIPICLLCYSGKYAKKLAHELNHKGYQAYYIEGGFQAFLNLQNNQYY